ncbi:hypothetical protein LSH36_7g04021 [Paralvinella palmiformis]|uniref:Guanylate cyclase soluble subunit beta-1 n=1 Tax=Paralvinella palmiformis TaxID=53620 RepID=A0AAD9KER6_9ANNE|nr:hypothetical protein LSH36_7g04021 [Paralvinella palmiformis]
MSAQKPTLNIPDLSQCTHRPVIPKRHMTTRSHCHPPTGSSVTMDPERKRMLTNLAETPPDTESLLGHRKRINHSCLAGNLHFTKVRRRCFIEYGFLNQALSKAISRRFGLQIWEEIKNASEVRIPSPVSLALIYEDRIAYNIVQTASEITGLTADEIWELFGETFFDFCEESGYEKIMQVLGGNLKDLFENLDALHDHLSSIYSGMRVPTFRCSEHDDGTLTLHYHSRRHGLEHVIIGLIKTVANKLQNKEMNVEILTSQSLFCPDHVQFLVTEKVTSQESPNSHKRGYCFQEENNDSENWLMNCDFQIGPTAFCKAFPFHVMFNRDFCIVQVGDSLVRIIPILEQPAIKFTDVFQFVRPQIHMSVDDVIVHRNQVFVVQVKSQISLTKRHSACPPYVTSGGRLAVPCFSEDCNVQSHKNMRLKGEMLYVPEIEKVIFLCSPSVGSLEELLAAGLFLSDIPAHDSTRDLLFSREQFRAEYELTYKLEILTDKLQETYRELEIEKCTADKLIYSILPPSVANKLREGQPVEAVKYHAVTILFTGICYFNAFCSHNSPIKVVNLLNELYTKFDALSDPRAYDVYKVETVGDKYMLASGLPEKTSLHARNIAQVALDMMDISRDVVVDGNSIKLQIGVHSGEVVAGVVGQRLPRYGVFGSTVCIASRMESTGSPDCINISETTYKYLNTKKCFDAQFSFKERGEIRVKGMTTPIKCYFLLRKRRTLLHIQKLLESGITVTSHRPCILTSLSDNADIKNEDRLVSSPVAKDKDDMEGIN